MSVLRNPRGQRSPLTESKHQFGNGEDGIHEITKVNFPFPRLSVLHRLGVLDHSQLTILSQTCQRVEKVVVPLLITEQDTVNCLEENGIVS